MAESPPLPVRLDMTALLGGLADIVEIANAGGGALPGLLRIAELAQSATGGIGATFLVYTGSEGRVVAATGAAAGSLGRRVDVADAAEAPHVRWYGARRAVRAATIVDDCLVGSLQIYFPEADRRADAHQLAVARLLAGCAGRFCQALTGPAARPHGAGPGGTDPTARDLFVAVASHELRTPVTVIQGYADTLVDHGDSLDEPTRRAAAGVIRQRARELAGLIDRLLHVFTDAAGLLGAGVRVPFDLAEALCGGAAGLSSELRHDLRMTVPDALPKALGDRVSLTAVFTELVTNGCRYSPERVEVEVTAGSDDHTVWFQVADRGVGIPPEHAERAFERFWQQETGDQRRYGAGLGLYLVRAMLDRQHGWVGLRPRAGGGTVAEVRLPRADVES